jgi:glutaredoxin-like protein
MSLIPDEHKDRLRGEFKDKLERPVKIVMFTQQFECSFCLQTRQLIEELAALNDKIKVEIYDFMVDAEKAKAFGVDKVPAVVFVGEKNYGMRFYGLPYGYELQTLLEGVISASRGVTDLSDETKKQLREINTQVHIQIFVTLTCPYCPVIAAMAYKFAMENDLIKTDIVDASEFPHLAIKYSVLGVPKTVINEKVEFVGVLPEDLFLEHVLLAALK